jgi:hypothetical protein
MILNTMAGSPTRELTPDELRRRRARVAKRRREQEIERQRKKKLTIGIGVTSLALLGLGGVFVAARAKSGGEGGVKALVQKASSAIKTRGILGAATALVTKSGAAAAESPVPQDRAAAPLFIFREGLEEGWQDWSWATHDKASRSLAGAGSVGVSMELEGTKGVYFYHNPFRSDGYGFLEFIFKGNPNQCMVTIFDGANKARTQVSLSKFIAGAANKSSWQKIRIPFSAFGMKSGDLIAGVVIQANIQGKSGTIGLDEIALTPDTALPVVLSEVAVRINIDASGPRKVISPLIYGVAHASKDELKTLGATAHRWGGNPNSRHNWVLNAWNSASDWEFRNHGGEGADFKNPGEASDIFVAETTLNNAVSFLTIPTLGWVAKNKDQNTKSESNSIPSETGPGISGPEGGVANYDPSANRFLTSVRSLPRKPGRGFQDAPKKTDVVYQDEFVAHLVKRFGSATNGGVRYYAMDNEPDLWSFTHRDVHPAQMGTDDVVRNYLEYATAIKDVDPSAQLVGPNISGWTGYFYSALDKGNDNFSTAADRKAHGGKPFLVSFLESVRAFDVKNKRRTLDVLDVHYYPQAQGIYSDARDPATQAQRLRTVRSLWDPSYKDESWIANTADGPNVMLIPRMKGFINQAYPGTKLCIGEWNFGAETDLSGGLATAEALGIFGREGVDLAFFWTRPKLNTPAASAFQLFRRPDSASNAPGFGDLSVKAESESWDKVACFSAKDSKTGEMTLILINKLPTSRAAISLKIVGETASGPARLWQFSAQSGGKLASAPAPSFSSGMAKFVLPPYSATLVRVGGGAK